MTDRKPRRNQAPKKVVHLNSLLCCQHCNNAWDVRDLNPERRTVPCPVCGTLNDIREAIRRAA